MKRFLSILLTALVFIACFSFSALAAEPRDMLLSRTEEVLENGDVLVTELYRDAVQPRTGASGYKVYTYRDSDGTTVWALTVNGSFTYNYGVSSQATGASATVNIYSSSAKFVTKDAYTRGNTATATATVKYNSVAMSRSVSVSCDKYGNLY